LRQRFETSTVRQIIQPDNVGRIVSVPLGAPEHPRGLTGDLALGDLHGFNA